MLPCSGTSASFRACEFIGKVISLQLLKLCDLMLKIFCQFSVLRVSGKVECVCDPKLKSTSSEKLPCSPRLSLSPLLQGLTEPFMVRTTHCCIV